jgi:hypothetical protein
VPKLLSQRPRTRADCEAGPRPCPWTTCRYHLAPEGATAESCALDVAARGGLTLEEIGNLLGVTDERIRQIIAAGLRQLRVDLSEAA